MNKLYSLLMGGVMAFSLTACMDSHDEPDTGHLTILQRPTQRFLM